MKKIAKELIRFWVSLGIGIGIGIGVGLVPYMTPTMLGFSIAALAVFATYLVVKQSMDEDDNK